jgi:hypothetical protein
VAGRAAGAAVSRVSSQPIGPIGKTTASMATIGSRGRMPRWSADAHATLRSARTPGGEPLGRLGGVREPQVGPSRGVPTPTTNSWPK